MSEKREWFVRGPGVRESEPLTETEIKTRLHSSSTDGMEVRQGSSRWFPANVVLEQFADLERNGIYLRNGEQTIGPYTAERAQKFLAKPGVVFDAYRLGINSEWQSIPDDLTRLFPPPLPNDEPPPLPNFLKEQTALVAVPRASGEKATSRKKKSGLQRTAATAAQKAKEPFPERKTTPRARNRFASCLRRVAISLVCLILLLVALSQLGYLNSLPRIDFIADLATRFSSLNPMAPSLIKASLPTEEYKKRVNERVASWELPDEFRTNAKKILNLDSVTEHWLELCYQKERLAEVKGTVRIRAAEQLQKMLSGIASQSAKASVGVETVQHTSEKLRLLIRDGETIGQEELVSTELGSLIESLPAAIATDAESLVALQLELANQQAAKPPTAIVYRDRIGKPYPTKEERDEAIQREVLSGEFDGSGGKGPPEVYAAYIERNLVAARGRDDADVAEQERKQQEHQQQTQRLENKIQVLSTCKASCMALQKNLEQVLPQFREYEKQYIDFVMKTDLELAQENKKVQSAIQDLIGQLKFPELPKSPASLQIEVPAFSIKPDRPDLDETSFNGVYLLGNTHKVEGDLYFMENKVIKIPNSGREHYMHWLGKSPNEVLIDGVFEFQGNRPTSFPQAIPIEDYTVPAAMIEYFEQLPRFKLLEEELAGKRAVYNTASKQLADKVRPIQLFLIAIRAPAGKDPAAIQSYINKLLHEASDLLGVEAKTISVTEPRIQAVDERIAASIVLEFDVPRIDLTEKADPVAPNPVVGPDAERQEKQKSPLFTDADREALLAVGCKPQEAKGDSNVIGLEKAVLTPAAADAIGHMDQLQILVLSQAKFDNEQLARIGYRPSVVDLWIWGTNLDEQGFVTVCNNFPNLRFISITAIKPLPIKSIRNIQKLDKLTSLSAGWAEIKYDDLDVIAKLPKLVTLDIQGTQIVDKDLKTLGECKTLKTLIVSKDSFKVSATALKVFNDAVPDCKLDIR